MEDGHPALVKNITEDKDIKSCGSRENPYIIKTAEDFIKRIKKQWKPMGGKRYMVQEKCN